jgi:SAM-dependent methyltransferase
MMDVDVGVERHYGRGRILEAIERALGNRTAPLAPADLAPVDEFHVRGREATVELAQRGSVERGARVIDVGSGLGGSARYLAAECGCRVTGIDLTTEYVEAANALAKRVGLAGRVEFVRASALSMPFDDASFDLAWTEHVQMNVADKSAFYREIARVLVPGGRLLFHDIFAGSGGGAHFPAPWADAPSISALVAPDEARAHIERAGMTIVDWEDRSDASLAWFEAMTERLRTRGPPPLGLHLLMGDTAPTKIANMVRNLAGQRIVVVQGVARKR